MANNLTTDEAIKTYFAEHDGAVIYPSDVAARFGLSYEDAAVACERLAAKGRIERHENQMNNNSTAAQDELRNILKAVEESEWHRHGLSGEEVKRICLTPKAIARIRAAVADQNDR